MQEEGQERAPRLFRFADLTLDPGQRSLSRGGEAIDLPRRSFDLLVALVEAAPDALSTDDLMDRVWNGAVVSPATVAKRVELLRQGLGDNSAAPKYIALVRGHGYRLIADVRTVARPAPARSRWLAIGAAGLMLAAGLMAAWFASRPDSPPDRSLAVLPFDVLVDDLDTRLFAEGLADDLRHFLSNQEPLRVTGRLSSIYFKDHATDLPPALQALGVAHVIEGTVRQQGDRTRITVQLTSTDDGFTLWSGSFDPAVTGSDDIQSSIARNVAAQLRVSLGDLQTPDSPASGGTRPDVYATYLRAVSLSPYGKFVGLGEAQHLIEEVVLLAPDFAPGWSRRAAIHGRRLLGRDAGYALSPDESLALISDSASRALALDPDNAEAYATRGGIAWVFEQDTTKAAPLIERALLLAGGNLDIISFAAEFAKYIGRIEQALQLEQLIIRRDPLCDECRLRLAKSLTYLGRYADARRELETLRSLHGDGYHWHLGIVRLMMGQPRDALELFDSISPDAEPHLRLAGRAMAFCDLRHDVEAQRALADLDQRIGGRSPQVVARAFAHCGEIDRAFEWLDASLPVRALELQVEFPDPTYDRLRDDPRWDEILRRIGRSKAQVAAISFSLGPALADLGE